MGDVASSFSIGHMKTDMIFVDYVNARSFIVFGLKQMFLYFRVHGCLADSARFATVLAGFSLLL